MRRFQLPRLVSRSQALASSIALLIVVLCMPLRAQAQLTITSGDTYTLSIGHVELQLSASGGTGAYTWSIIGGTPPPGLMLRSDVPPWFSPGVGEGLIGVATTPGTYNFTIQVADGAASTAQQAVSVTITSFIITSSQNLPDGFEGTPYAHQETVTGFPNGATLTWTPNAPMPPGLSLGSDGLLSGTPTQSGFFNVEYRVSDGFDLVNANHNLGIFPVQITTDALLPFATINQSYNQTLAASGGSGNYTFTFGGGSLPNGVSFNAGTISGTPTQAGRYAFSVTVADANDNGKSYTKQMSLVVANVPPTLPQIVPYGNRVDDCTVGVQCERAFGNFSLGPAPITWTASGLPIGMSIRWGSLANQWVSPGDGEIWGTPAAAGNYSVTLTTTDATGASATNTFPLHVSALIQTNNLPGGAMGAAYSTAFRVVGGSGSYTAALTGGSLPLGLTFDGVLLTISGTPIEGGSFNPQFTFDDGQGNVKTDTYFLYISNAGSTAQPLSINNSDLGNAMLNAPWSYQLNACCRASVVWSLESGSLPAGVSLSSGGLLSGTPTVAGQHTFVVRATDGADFTTRQLTLNVTPVFISMNTSLPFGNVSVPYSQQLQASGGTGPYTWTLAPGSFLPPGLTLTSDGLLAGTPPASGQFNFNVNVEDTVTLNRTVGYFSLAIYPTDALPPLRITTNGNFGTWSIGAIQTELDAFDGAGGYTWSLFSGDLPPGLAVRPDGPPWFSHSASGGIIGVATTPGTYNFTLRVTDHDGAFVDLAGTMRIVPLTIKDLWNLPDAFTNTAYSYTLTPLGNGGAVTWGAPNCGNPSCLLPPGLTLNSATGEISGTPTTPGFYNSQISVSADGATIVWSLNIGVHAINVGASTPLVGGATYELPNATQGQPYSVTFTASGGSAPLTFSSNSLPNGLSLDPLSGVMSGTYNGGSGRFWFSITATDSTATSYTRSFAVRGVTSPAVLPGIGINGGRFDDCTLGMGCTRGMWVASGAAAPFTWSASGLPAGMSLRPGGVAYWNDGTPAGDAEIWGVPTELGDFNVTITVTDATGAQVSGVFPLHVSELWLDTRLPNGTYNTGYGPGGLGANLRVLGGSASYSTALTSTPNNRLPAGLLFDGANNVVAGTPFETGSFNPDLLISDTANPAHQLRLFNFFFISDQGIGTIQINTGSDLGYWSPGSNANITFSACCVPSYVWSVDGGSLPAGTSLNWNTGQLTGTLTTAGTFAFLLRASNANDTSNFAVRQFTLVVSPLIQTTFTLPFGNLNVPYSQTLSAGCVNGFTCNGTSFSLAPYSVLPPGLALGSGGLLSGTPTATGLFSFTVLATDLGGHTLRMNFSLSIYPVGELPPVNLSIGPNLGPFQIGQVTINLSTSNTSGGVPPYHYALSPGANVIPGMRVQDGPPLPTNFTSASFSPVPTATFIGVITSPGSYSTSIRASDSVGHFFDKAITIAVSPLAILTATNIPKATVGASYSFFLSASGGSGIYAWSASNLPAGVLLDSSTGEVNGTPTTAGSGTITVTLTDVPSGQSVSANLTFVRNAFAITTGVLPAAANGHSYSQQLTAPGCAGCVWTLQSGSLPAGLTLTNAGLLSGTPTGSGTVIFTVRATSGSVTVDKVLAVIVEANLPQALVVTTSSPLNTTTVGFNTTTQFNATGGTPPYLWSLEAGSLPPGISFVSSGDTVNPFLAPGVGYAVGKPLQTGTYTFTLRVTDAVAATATQTFTWPISAINLQYTSLPVRDNQGNLFVSALTRGVAYSQPLLAIGGTSAYTWTATMPAGLTLDASTGMVGGTPLDTGTFNVPITIVDNDGHSFLGNENIIISPAAGTVTFGVGATQTLVQGSSASINLSPSGGTAPYTVTALTPLPPGFALETGNAVLGTATPGSSFFLAGAPMAAGVFTVTLQAQDFGGNIGERTFTLTVVPVANFTGNTLADGSVGAPYSAQLVWFDNAGTLTWSVTPGSALPAGLTLSSAGLLSGTPASAGSYSFNATVRDSATGLSTNPSISVKISPLAIMGSDFLPIATVTQPYSYTFAATGAGSVSWSISTSGLPNGLSVSQATGTISGTPLSGAGTVTITVTATNGPNSVTRRFTLFVRPVNLLPPNLPLLQTALPDGTVGQLYSASISPNGGLPPYTWSVASGSLPPGLSLLSGAQIPPTSFPGLTFIGGLPTVAGQYSFDLVLTDANGAQSVRTFSVNVSAINILSGQPRTAITGQAYAQQFTVVGGTAPYTFTASRQPASPTADLLPPGITLLASGLLSGTTTSTGVYTFVIRAQDAAGNSFARTAQLVVNSPSGLRVQSGNPGDVYVGSGFFQSLVTNGGSTYSWSVSGALPPGLSIVTDPAVPTSTTLIGQPSVAGGYTYTLRATDTANGANFADRTFTMNVSPMQVVTPPLLNFIIPNAQAGVAYSTTVKVAGGTPPYSFSASSAAPIPPGLTLGADGTLSGTPTQVGSFSIGLIATDAAGRVYHLPAPTLVVTPAGTPGPIAAVQNVQTMDDASVGVPYRFALVQDRGGVAPFSWTVLSPLPPGLAIVSGSNGVPDHLAGVPTTAGSYSFKLTVTDSIGQSVPVSYLLNVSPLALTPDSLAPGRVGVAYMASLAPVGGVGPYAIQALSDWDLPPGLTLSPAGVLSGTPTAPGLFAMRVVVTDNASHTLSRMFVVYVDNAIGESPAVTFVPRSIQLSYTQTFPDPGAIAVGVNTTSGTPAYNVAIEGIPGATLSAPGGTAPGSVSLDLHVTTLGVGTYSGVLALKSAPTTNEYDVIPVTVTVAALPQCTYDVSPASTTIGAAGGAGTFDLSTAGHCSWTASVSQPSWISLTSAASGTGAATIGFRIASNPFASQRSGTITVNGGVYTISQFGSACSFVINPISLSAPAGGGITSVGVTASDSICGWSASSLDLGVSPAAGSGNGTVTVTIPPNLAAGVRQLTASIAGQTFTVNQQGVDCTVAVDPSSASFSDAGGLGSSTITTPAACGYDTTSTPSWVTITSGGSSLSGSGTLQYTVNANSATTPRTGSIVVGGQTLTISQGAAACSVTLDTAALGSPFGTGAGSGAIGVIANGDNCAWSVSGSANWVTFAPNAASGSGTVSIGVAANLLVLSRTATVAIAGQMVTISQSGQACSYALQSSTGSVPAAGGSGTVGVLTPAACSWNPVSSDPTWLSVGPGSTGSGDASFVATANPNPSPRAATVTIAGLVYTVTQPAAPCTYTLGASSVSVSGNGGSGTFAVASDSAACTPAPVSYANWITIGAVTSNGASFTVNFSVQPNPLSVPRTGSIQVGDQTFTVTENLSPSACLYSLHAYGAVFNRGGGGGDVFGSPSALGCDPTSTIGTDQPSFITLLLLSGPVNDIFTQPFSVLPFDTPLTAVIRRGRITFGGQIFVVKQVSW